MKTNKTASAASTTAESEKLDALFSELVSARTDEEDFAASETPVPADPVRVCSLCQSGHIHDACDTVGIATPVPAGQTEGPTPSRVPTVHVGNVAGVGGEIGMPYYTYDGREPEYDQGHSVVVWYDDLFNLGQRAELAQRCTCPRVECFDCPTHGSAIAPPPSPAPKGQS